MRVPIKMTFVFLFAIGLMGLTQYLQAANTDNANAMGDSGSKSNAASGTAATSDSGSATKMRGQIISVDQTQNQMVVKEEASGAQRTMKVEKADVLKNLQKGDQVWVTPSPSDPSMATAVTKEKK